MSNISNPPSPQYLDPQREISQIISCDGSTAYDANGTSNIDLHYGQVFSSPVGGNTVTPYVTGKAYFADLIAALEKAEKEILIGGWQINWDAQLAPGKRLFDVLLALAQKPNGPTIHVMPWKNPSQVETYAAETKAVFDAIGDLAPKRVFTYLSPILADEKGMFYSHHQKLVTIDRKVAFIGGIDIAYGRYDDETCTLSADAEGRDGFNRYNPCVPMLGTMAGKEIDIDLLTGGYDQLSGNRKNTFDAIRAGALQSDKNKSDNKAPSASLDPARQPRMPWQDLHHKIEGPAAANIAACFVLRWNINVVEGLSGVNPPKLPAPKLNAYPLPGQEGCSVQVLRSASTALRTAEAQRVLLADRTAVFTNQNGAPAGMQDDIYRQMQILIEQSQHYIYIENQFFNSAFGDPVPAQDAPLSGPAQQTYNNSSGMKATRLYGGSSDGRIRNRIIEALAGRLDKAVRARNPMPFHLYIVLPVHPEGLLNGGPTINQIHWTMQSLVFGSTSLLERLKASLIKAKRPEGDWPHYLTLLNLRNWGKLGERYVTEQIYVHTKLMIVDDRYVLHGSANINDRSLLGGRDSEIAVMIHDSQETCVDLDGTGNSVLTLNYARQLRKAVWRKLFGLDLNSSPRTGGAQPASELESVLDRPADPKTVAAIRGVARVNRKAYEAAFDWVPRNKSIFDPDDKDTSSIWPRWKYPGKATPRVARTSGEQTGLMPFQAAFWDQPQHKPAAAEELAKVRGFITELPIEWTQGENNNIGYATALITENRQQNPAGQNSGTGLAQNEAPELEQAGGLNV